MQPEHWDLILRCVDPADLYLRLIGIGREEDQRPLPARRYPHDPWQALVEAMHPQAVQVDARRLRAESAALRNHAVNLQVSYPAKYISGSVNVRMALEGIPIPLVIRVQRVEYPAA